jgi:hypothetical protein
MKERETNSIHIKQAGGHVHIMEVNPTAGNIARLVFEFVADSSLPVIEASLWETRYELCR